MLARMNLTKLVPLILIAACSSGPSKQDSLKVFAATNSAMASIQSTAVTASRTTALVPASVTVNYTGACTGGGTAAVTGTYDGDGTNDQAAFDMTMTFTNCTEELGSIDGTMHWTSVASGTSFMSTMTGSISYHDPQTDASCAYDVSLDVTSTTVTYSGTMCGYDVDADLNINHP